MSWIELFTAMALFMASHRIPALLGLKERLTAAFGARGYALAFSVVSTLLLAWTISAAGRAPYVGLWDQAPWMRWAANVAMPAAILLGAFGVGAPNPFAFEGRAAGFDPERPGVAGLTRQPLLWALALWAGAHLLVNGDLAHTLLFGPFLMLALIGMPIVERRRRRALGEAEWTRLTARTGLAPFAALATGRWRPQEAPSPPSALVGRALAALALWALLWSLHGPVIGVSPAP